MASNVIRMPDPTGRGGLVALDLDSIPMPVAGDKVIKRILNKAARSKHTQVSATVMATPEVFLALLKRVDSERQRKRRPHTVARYHQDIEEGLWSATGQSYILDIDGNLNDGQHRAEAFYRAGQTCEIVLVVTKDADAYAGTDIGARRSAADVFKARTGERAPGSLLSAIVYESLDFQFSVRISPRMKDKLVENYDLLTEAALLPKRGLAGQVAAALRACRLDVDLAIDFFDAAMHGYHHINGEPVKHLELLCKAMANLRDRGVRTGDILKQGTAYFSLQAFRAFYEGRYLKKLQRPRSDWGGSVKMPITLKYVEREIETGFRRRADDPIEAARPR